MDFEILVALAVFTEKAVTWSRVSEAIADFNRRGALVPSDIQEAFDLLGDDLDQMLATAPPEVVGLA